MLIEEVKEALPDIKIIMLEPFVLKGPATEENWDEFYNETKLRAQSVKEVADEITLSNDEDGVALIVEKYMKN